MGVGLELPDGGSLVVAAPCGAVAAPSPGCSTGTKARLGDGDELLAPGWLRWRADPMPRRCVAFLRYHRLICHSCPARKALRTVYSISVQHFLRYDGTGGWFTVPQCGQSYASVCRRPRLMLPTCNLTEALWNKFASYYHLLGYDTFRHVDRPQQWEVKLIHHDRRRDIQRKLGLLFFFWWQV